MFMIAVYLSSVKKLREKLMAKTVSSSVLLMARYTEKRQTLRQLGTYYQLSNILPHYIQNFP